jgi:hypothetical protein
MINKVTHIISKACLSYGLLFSNIVYIWIWSFSYSFLYNKPISNKFPYIEEFQILDDVWRPLRPLIVAIYISIE